VIFVDVPTAIAKGTVAALEALYEGMIQVFGHFIAGCIWILTYLIITPFVYFPIKIFWVLVDYSKVILTGGKEILVWFNPKR